MGRKRYWKEEAEIVDGIAVYLEKMNYMFD